MENSLESLFENPAAASQEVVEVVEKVAPVIDQVEKPVVERVRDESGKFAKPADKVEEAPAPTAAPAEVKAEIDPPVDLKAYHAAITKSKDEVRKRQELERQVEEFRRKQQEWEAAKETKAPIDPLSDPEGYTRGIEQKIHEQVLQSKIQLSVSFAKQKWPDYTDAVKDWPTLVEADPSLMQKAATADNPAEFVYNHMQRHKQMLEIGDDPAAFRARIVNETKQQHEAEMRAQIEADLRAQFEAEYSARTPIPPTPQPRPTPSLAAARGGGRVSEATTFVQPSLENIIKR